MELDFANGLLSALGLSYSDPHVIFKVEPWFGLLRQVIGCRSLVAGHWLPVRPACSQFSYCHRAVMPDHRIAGAINSIASKADRSGIRFSMTCS